LRNKPYPIRHTIFEKSNESLSDCYVIQMLHLNNMRKRDEKYKLNFIWKSQRGRSFGYVGVKGEGEHEIELREM
jgi:hypothetical protein